MDEDSDGGEASPFASFRLFDPVEQERYRQQQEREQRALEQRLEGLLAHRGAIDRACGVAMAAAVTDEIPWVGASVVVPPELLGRLWKGEPRPLLSRLLSRRSDYVLQVLALIWLLGVDPWDAQARSVTWEQLLPLRAGKAQHGSLTERKRAERARADDARTRRSALRALDIITVESRAHDIEMAAWTRSLTEAPKLAWVTPRRPARVLIPASFFSNGWHVTLSKPELAWWLVGRLVAPGKPTDRIRHRYVGFSKHVTGTDWLQAPTVLEAVTPAQPAVPVLSRLLLETLGRRAASDWPRVEFVTGEHPVLIVRGTTDRGRDAVLIATNEQWHLHQTHVEGGHVDFLERVPGRYQQPSLASGLRFNAIYDALRSRFEVYPPGRGQGEPLMTVHRVRPDSIWGSRTLYATRS